MGPQRVSTTECAHTWVSFCFKRMHSPLVFRVSSALITTGPLIMPCLCRRLPAGMEFCTLQSTWGLELHSIGALLCLGDSRLAVCHVGRRVLWRGMGSLAQPPPSNLRAMLSFLNIVFPDPENEAVVPIALHLIGCLSIFQGHMLSPVTQWLPSWLVVNLVEETLQRVCW